MMTYFVYLTWCITRGSSMWSTLYTTELSMKNSSTTSGWKGKSNFQEEDYYDVQTLCNQELKRNHAVRILKIKIK